MKKTFITLFLASLIMTVGYAQERQKDTFKTKSGKDVTFTCIKHATFQIEYDGRNFYFVRNCVNVRFRAITFDCY